MMQMMQPEFHPFHFSCEMKHCAVGIAEGLLLPHLSNWKAIEQD